MPRNSSGTYSLPAAYNPVVTDELITAAWANTTLNDLATAATDSLDRQGRGGMLAPFKNADGTIGLPGITFLNEVTSGFSRVNSGELSVSILAAEVATFTSSLVDFLVQPRYASAPSDGASLVNRDYVTATFAPLASPAFTGTPTAPTAAAGVSSLQVANMEAVLQEVASVNAHGQLSTVLATGTAVTVAAGQRVGCSNAGQVTVTLPPSPMVGDSVSIRFFNTRTDNIVAGNGQKIEDDLANFNCNIRTPYFFVFVGDAYGGWRQF